MTVDEIKQAYSLPDVLERFGVGVNRAGFCRCIYHTERTASMKIYPNNTFYSFCCGKSGDQITAAVHLTGMPFTEALEALTGERMTKATKRAIALAKMRREAQAKREQGIRWKMYRAGELANLSGRIMRLSDPFSDEWCEAVNNYNRHCDEQDELLEQFYEHR